MMAGSTAGVFLRMRHISHSVLTRSVMACNPDMLKQVPLFALLDEEEIAVLAAQVE
jgi:hypothetical protein